MPLSDSCPPVSVLETEPTSSFATASSVFHSLMNASNLQALFATQNENSGPSTRENSSERGLEDNKNSLKNGSDYLERRKKNNDSARKSREVRRLREHQTRQKMEILQKENIELQGQITMLRLEYNQLVLMLIAQQTTSINAQKSTL